MKHDMQTPTTNSPTPAPKLNLDRIRQFLNYYKRMSRSQKASLLAFAFMVFAIPFSVTASLNQIRSRSKAAAPISAPVTPPPSTPPPSTPSPGTPTPTPSPIIKPSPSLLPSPTFVPKPINIPVLMTNSLPDGYLRISYQALVTGYTSNPNTGLNLSTSGLPAGLSLTNCRQFSDDVKNTITCYISGKPKKAGDYSVTLNLSDAFSVSVTKSVSLKIESQKFKFTPVNWIYEKFDTTLSR